MANMPAAHDLLLPEGTRLVHIGPPKTGTTSLQSAFHGARESLTAQGVHYAGRKRHSVEAVRSVVGLPDASGTPPPIAEWQELVRDIRRAGASRVVLSSEHFARAERETIRSVVSDLDPSRVHVVVTLRAIAKLVTSQWQQFVQKGATDSLDSFLERVFDRPDGALARSFWLRHRHDALVARWTDVVGSANVTVVALDDRDHAMVLRTFERLLGLTEGILVPDPTRRNRSMTLPEIEMVRAFNAAYFGDALPRRVYTRLMAGGAVRFLKRRTADPDALPIEPPQWAFDRSAEIGREMLDRIVASGVRVVGAPDRLTEVLVSRRGGSGPPGVVIPPELAAAAILGAIRATGQLASAKGRGRPSSGVSSLVRRVTRFGRARRSIRSVLAKLGRSPRPQ